MRLYLRSVAHYRPRRRFFAFQYGECGLYGGSLLTIAIASGRNIRTITMVKIRYWLLSLMPLPFAVVRLHHSIYVASFAPILATASHLAARSLIAHRLASANSCFRCRFCRRSSIMAEDISRHCCRSISISPAASRHGLHCGSGSRCNLDMMSSIALPDGRTVATYFTT